MNGQTPVQSEWKMPERKHDPIARLVGESIPDHHWKYIRTEGNYEIWRALVDPETGVIA